MMTEDDLNSRSDILELLAGDALGDLDAVERKKLVELLTASDEKSAEELRLTAGALQLALASSDVQAMPTSLRDKIAAEASQHLSSNAPLALTQDAAAQSVAQVQRVVTRAEAKSISQRERLAWLCAAASLLLAIGFWISGRQSPLSQTIALNPSRARAELIAQAKDRVEIAWTNGTTPFGTAVSGDVIWSNSRQQGYLRFVGMPINDPRLEQYQLWIIDPSRDDEPIDGGVFDVTSNGEVIIPIDAKLNVVDPAVFAVTIEKPGGVVVSDQKRLPLLAKVADAKS